MIHRTQLRTKDVVIDKLKQKEKQLTGKLQSLRAILKNDQMYREFQKALHRGPVKTDSV